MSIRKRKSNLAFLKTSVNIEIKISTGIKYQRNETSWFHSSYKIPKVFFC